jgi:hypothetical protein
MMKVVRWLGLLAQDYKRCFMILMTGQCIFFVGIALFYISAKHYDAQPLLSELVAFFGIILIFIGVAVALVGYLSLTYGRWYHFFKRRPGSRKNPIPQDEIIEKKVVDTAPCTEHNLVDTTATNKKEE